MKERGRCWSISDSMKVNKKSMSSTLKLIMNNVPKEKFKVLLHLVNRIPIDWQLNFRILFSFQTQIQRIPGRSSPAILFSCILTQIIQSNFFSKKFRNHLIMVTSSSNQRQFEEELCLSPWECGHQAQWISWDFSNSPQTRWSPP